MSEVLIELRQKNDNTFVNNNGDYIVTLPEPIQVSKNDQLSIKQAFIDTVSRAQGKIIIPDDVDQLTFNYCLYLQDQDSTRAEANTIKDYFGLAAPKGTGNTPTGKTYVLCSQDPNPAGGGGITMCTFNEIILADDMDNSRFIRDRYMKGRLLYKDIHGNEKPFNFEIRREHWSSAFPDGVPVEGGEVKLGPSFDWHDAPPFNVVCQRDAYGPNTPLKYASGGEKDAHDGKFIFKGVANISVINTDTIYTPWEFSTTFAIERSKQYLPSEFTKLLTRALTFGSDIDGTYPNDPTLTNNFTLQTLAQLKARGTSANGGSPNAHPFWISTDCTRAIRYIDIPDQPNFLFGSSAVNFGFDLDTNIATLDRMHSAIYSGNNEAVVPMKITDDKFLLNKTGGIFFTGCSQPDLLTKGLNLPNSIFVKPKGNVNKSIGTLQNSSFPEFFLAEGINITGHASFLDSLIPKNSDPTNNQPTFDVAPVFHGSAANYATAGGIISDQITAISSEVPVGQDDSSAVNSDIGYYQIEIDSNFNFSKYSNSRNSTKIGAIVNKYYSTDNYTTCDQSMSTPYYHTEDQPILIKDFKVRFLYPSGEPVDPTTLQSDNTVFLSLLKNA